MLDAMKMRMLMDTIALEPFHVWKEDTVGSAWYLVVRRYSLGHILTPLPVVGAPYRHCMKVPQA